MTKNKEAGNGPFLRLLLGAVLILASGITGVVLAFQAAAAKGLSFWELASLNDFGRVTLIWGYRPELHVIAVLVGLTGFILFITNRSR